jgi:hypothetical protein
VRCNTFLNDTGHTVIYTPYFFSKAATSGPMSSFCADV